ncbi:MAG TPA: FHA domain-containing protein [Bryobacteraceae bacterium]|nr:FHA domain-containing protein [Bryobacteraceae bacterium]
MSQTGTKFPQTRISGQIIIDEIIRNMELGRLEMGYSILLPCIFSVYLHPDDYARIAGVQEIIRDDARRVLSARLAEWNRGGSLFRRGARGAIGGALGSRPRKDYRIAQSDWWIEFFADTEGAVPQGDVEIHSELNDVAQPGYRGVKTTLIEREPSVTSVRVARDRAERAPLRASVTRLASEVFAEIRYQDDSGPQTYYVTQNEISIGRGGEDLWVDLPLYTNEEVSREHLRLRRDPATGTFTLLDKSRNGTWLNGKRLARGAEEKLPDRAEIGVAEVLKLAFEVRR